MSDAQINRVTGLLLIEARMSNPNGDPDQESDPRTLSIGDRGLISPVSYKRKLRELVDQKDGPVWNEAASKFSLSADRYDILEKRSRRLKELAKLSAEQLKAKYWDGRLFGNTLLEAIKNAKEETGEQIDKKDLKEAENKEHFIRAGVVQFGVGISLAPVQIERLTTTNVSGVQEGKDRGMAPLGFRVVRHALYVMPFFVNPTASAKTGCGQDDLRLLRYLIPQAYRHTASVSRPFVDIVHGWWIEHKSPLGSCPDGLLIDALTPKKKGDPEQPSTSLADYEVATGLPSELQKQILGCKDLCAEA